MMSQITNLTIAYSTVYSGVDFYAENSQVTGEFPAQMASNAEMLPFDDVIMANFLKWYANTRIIEYRWPLLLHSGLRGDLNQVRRVGV